MTTRPFEPLTAHPSPNSQQPVPAQEPERAYADTVRPRDTVAAGPEQSSARAAT